VAGEQAAMLIASTRLTLGPMNPIPSPSRSQANRARRCRPGPRPPSSAAQQRRRRLARHARRRPRRFPPASGLVELAPGPALPRRRQRRGTPPSPFATRGVAEEQRWAREALLHFRSRATAALDFAARRAP